MIKRKAPLSLLVTLDSISKNTLDFFSVSQSRQCLQIIGCDKVILRYLNSLLLILFVSIAATSCSDDNHKIIRAAINKRFELLPEIHEYCGITV